MLSTSRHAMLGFFIFSNNKDGLLLQLSVKYPPIDTTTLMSSQTTTAVDEMYIAELFLFTRLIRINKIKPVFCTTSALNEKTRFLNIARSSASVVLRAVEGSSAEDLLRAVICSFGFDAVTTDRDISGLFVNRLGMRT